MKQSLTYYITLLVIKLKGIKKEFSKTPIDYKKIRKEDIYHPTKKSIRKNNTATFTISNTSITQIKKNSTSDKLLIYIHGGAFIAGPARHHWDTLQEILKQTNHTIWMCNYPKAPEHKILEISKNIDSVYTKALEKYSAGQIVLMGDSVGGTLITTLIQRLVKKNNPAPSKIILISPVMDASMSNPQIEDIDTMDPMLSKVGVLSAKKMCAGNVDLKNVMISPLYGSFDAFPHTILFIAENDITYPDQLLAVEKLKEANVTNEIIKGKHMPHIWPLLPVMQEAKVALKEIINKLNS